MYGKAHWMNPIERKIFSRLGDLKPSYQSQKQIHQFLCRDADVYHLIKTALKEGIAGLLYQYLLETELLDRLSGEPRKKLEAIYYQILYSNLKLTHALKSILRQLKHQNIQVVLLQGIDLNQQVYGNLGLRPMTDIDFWVLPENYPDLISVLLAEDYKRAPLYPNTFRKGSTILDVHTHILWADRIPARKWLIRKSEEEIYYKTVRLDIEGESARCLNPYDQVIYLSLHVLKHCANRLIWLVDIKSLLVRWDKADWEGFMDRAKELGQERILSYVFFLLAHILDFHVPSKVKGLVRDQQLHAYEKKILRKRINGEALPQWGPVLLFSSGMELKTRLRFMFQSIFPNPEILRQVFADSPNLKVWELYCRRIFQVFGQR